MSLAGCTGSDASGFMQALANDHNPVCVDITFTTPWGTEHVQINRMGGCLGASAVIPAPQVVPAKP
jgi:hypothetical protein